LGALGITSTDGQTITDETENSENVKVTIPASVRVFWVAKSDLTMRTDISARELYVTGKSAATLLLRSRFVENGILRVAKQASIAQFPANAITAWWGNRVDELPAGWAFCDGQEHIGPSGVVVRTPDLRGMFLREGASSIGNSYGQEVYPTGLEMKSTQVRALDHTYASPITVVTDVRIQPTIPALPPHKLVAYICKLP